MITNEKIPKIIHFCWFGKGKYSKLIVDCIDSWKRLLPDYEIKMWNEDSFDVNQCIWTKEAYEQKKWAFVSDYVRLYALSTYGGVYMDTDVEVLRDFSCFLEKYSFVTSFTEGGLITTSFLASIKHHPYVSSLLDYYQDRHFVDPDKGLDMLMNPKIFALVAKQKYNLDPHSASFSADGFTILPCEYFQPYRKNIFGSAESHKNYHITENTFIIHKDMGSWSKKNRISFFIKGLTRLLLPERIYTYIKTKKNANELKKIQY